MKNHPALSLFRLFGAVALLGLAQPAVATVGLEFSLDGTGAATGFSNTAAAAGINGLRWGVVVDTANNGFSGPYDGDFNINTSGFLTVGGVATDDYYVAHPTQDLTQTLPATGGDPGGPGGITAITSVPFDGGTGITQGDPFQIIWFETGTAVGNKYGVLANSSGTGTFVIPADMSLQSYAAFFAGPTADPIKGTTLTLDGPDHGVLAIDAAPGSTITVAEEAGSVPIPIIRTDGDEGVVGFTITASTIAPDNATLNVDYQSPVSPQSLGDGVTTLNVPVPILPPGASEPNEVFTVTISAPTGGATLGAVTTVKVRIIDSVDTTNPAVTIAVPLANSIHTTPTVNISGTATDAKGIKQVQVSLNGGLFVDATLTIPGANSPTSTTYNHAVTPIGGVNTVAVKSIDHRNNTSAIVTRSFIVHRPLVVNVVDSLYGSVTAGFAGSTMREPGKSYTITATPKVPTTTPVFPGGLFTGWTVTGATNAQIGIAESAKAKQTLTFIFREGLELTANFIENPFGTMAGTYNGLIRPDANLPDRPTPQVDGTTRTNATEGGFKATVQNTGAFSATMTIDGLTLTFSGAFDNLGVARFGTARLPTQTVARTGKPSLIVALQMDMNTPGANDNITGTVTATGFQQSVVTAVSNVTSDRAYYNGTTLIVPAAYLAAANANGVFTTILPPRLPFYEVGVTFDETTEEVDAGADNSFVNGSVIVFGGSPPAPLVAGDEYFVVNKTGDLFQVSAVSNGAPIDISVAGSATAVLDPETRQVEGYAGTDYPQGYGHGTVVITKAGVVTITGTMPDGTTVSASSALSQTNTFPLFAQLYSKLGFLSGMVDLNSADPDSDMSAVALKWLRPLITTSHYYPAGWTDPIDVDFLGARYAMVAGQSVLKAPGGGNIQVADADGNAELTFTNGQLSDDLLKVASVTTGDVVTKVPSNDPTFTLSIVRTTGLISGSLTHTDDTVPTYTGTMYQKGTFAGAYGFFRTKQPPVIDYTGESGAVILIGLP